MRYGGRTKGTANKPTLQLAEKAKELGCDPFEILCLFALGDWKRLGYKDEYTFAPTQKGEVVEKLVISPDIRQKAASDACGYLYPKRKAIEHTGEVTQLHEEKLSHSEIQEILVQDPFLKKKKNGKSS
jgi:hypothetical protein